MLIECVYMLRSVSVVQDWIYDWWVWRGPEMVRAWVRATQVSTVPWVDFSRTHSGVSLIYMLAKGWVGMWTHRSPQVFTASNETHLPVPQSNLNPNSVPVLLILMDLRTSLISFVALIYLQQDSVWAQLAGHSPVAGGCGTSCYTFSLWKYSIDRVVPYLLFHSVDVLLPIGV